MVSAAREARYIPGGIRETSRRVDCTGGALVEPAKSKIASGRCSDASTIAVCACRPGASMQAVSYA